MIEFFGFLSVLCFGLCAVPQSIKCLRDKSAKGVSTGMVILWVSGEISAVIYAVYALGSPFWLLLNYALSTLSLVPVVYYKIKRQ